MYLHRLAAPLLLAALFLTACQSGADQQTAATAAPPAETTLTGAQLATAYCGSCHQRPDPALLDKKTWQQGVLPQMALRLGQSTQQMQALGQFSDQTELTRILEANIFPEHPTLHERDWQKLMAYYTSLAPDSLPNQPAHPPLRADLSLFKPEAVRSPVRSLVTLLRYDSLNRAIWAGTASGQLFRLDTQFRPLDSLTLTSSPVDLQPLPGGGLAILQVGVLNPNDRLAGSWGTLKTGSRQPATAIRNLGRPVQATTADLNRDGRPDQVICQFGHYLGRLTWHEQTATGYREHVLDPAPGARQTIVRDLDGDGWPDILALLTQGDEQVAAYYNRHNGTFRKVTVLRFPPVYGSSAIDLVDMDGDGHDDLVYTNGDNADYSIVAKPYHGVRIFHNDGQFRFRPVWFYPLHGATQTLVRDFDQDGRPDLATIAQFPDYDDRPNASFVYFANRGNGRYEPRTFPNAGRGRWLVMDAGDVDQDGDLDLLLGSFFRPTGPAHADLMTQWRQPGAGLLLLRNQFRP